MSFLNSLIREPLLHFLIIGAGLFVLFYQVSDPQIREDQNKIIVTLAEIEQLRNQWQQQWKRPPTNEELQGMIDAYIRETILYREALALGLDKDDIIIRRRLGQKLEFIFKDLAEQIEPDEAELQQHLEDNITRYTDSIRSTFDHVYFNPDKRGADISGDAAETLELLKNEAAVTDPLSLGDRFLYQYNFENQSKQQIARVFGREFAENLDNLEVGQWSGPVESGYGLHLVFLSDRAEPQAPTLEAVRDKVRWDLLALRQKELDTAFYEDLLQRYEIEIESSNGEPTATDAIGG